MVEGDRAATRPLDWTGPGREPRRAGRPAARPQPGRRPRAAPSWSRSSGWRPSRRWSPATIRSRRATRTRCVGPEPPASRSARTATGAISSAGSSSAGASRSRPGCRGGHRHQRGRAAGAPVRLLRRMARRRDHAGHGRDARLPGHPVRDGDRGHPGQRLHERDDRRGHQLDPGVRAARAGLGALGRRARLRRGGPRPGLPRRPDHGAPPPAQRRRPAVHLRDAPRLGGDHLGRLAELPRARRPAAHARVGRHAGGRPGLHARLLVARDVPRARHHGHHAVDQPVQQRPAGRAGPAASAGGRGGRHGTRRSAARWSRSAATFPWTGRSTRSRPRSTTSAPA